MFAGFNLKISESFFNNEIDEYVDLAEKYCTHSTLTEDMNNLVIDTYVNEEVLDGEKILKKWFPEIKCDVFISHSHADYRLANAFAGWLKKHFNINAFIDSNVWNYIDKLLKKLNEYSDKRRSVNGWLYDYDKCNRASQHANIMLLMSLQKMIDNTEAIFFLNTDSSVNDMDDNGVSSTYSPWIYAELLCANLIRKRELDEYRMKNILEHCSVNAATESRAELKIRYKILTNNLIELTSKNLIEWNNRYESTKKAFPMDLLYEMFIEEESNVDINS